MGSEEKTESNLIKSSKLLVGDYFGCSSHFNELLVLLLVRQLTKKCGFVQHVMTDYEKNFQAGIREAPFLFLK